jgi:chromosome segregation ATPase
MAASLSAASKAREHEHPALPPRPARSLTKIEREREGRVASRSKDSSKNSNEEVALLRQQLSSASQQLSNVSKQLNNAEKKNKMLVELNTDKDMQLHDLEMRLAGMCVCLRVCVYTCVCLEYGT